MLPIQSINKNLVKNPKLQGLFYKFFMNIESLHSYTHMLCCETSNAIIPNPVLYYLRLILEVWGSVLHLWYVDALSHSRIRILMKLQQTDCTEEFITCCVYVFCRDSCYNSDLMWRKNFIRSYMLRSSKFLGEFSYVYWLSFFSFQQSLITN